jgi:hypothetical protein
MLIPGATRKLIPPGANDPRIKARMGILHVAATNATSLYEFFNGPSGGIESHAYILKNGSQEQYRDTDYQADANYDANDFAISFETQGLASEKWTTLQLETIKKDMLWAKKAHNIPLRVVKTWDDPVGGWGYHTLFGSPSHWTPVAKSCPGPLRIEQFHDILVPWMKEASSGDMFEKDDSQRLERVEAKVDDLAEAFTKFRVGELTRDRALRDRLKTAFNATDEQLDEILNQVS